MNYAWVATGIIVVVIGAILFPLPVPFGAILIAVGLAILARESYWLRSRIQRWRSRNPRMNDRLRQLREKLPDTLGQPLADTEPATEPVREVGSDRSNVSR